MEKSIYHISDKQKYYRSSNLNFYFSSEAYGIVNIQDEHTFSIFYGMTLNVTTYRELYYASISIFIY